MGFWGQTATETCQNCGSALGAQGECTACLLQLGVSQHPSANEESPRPSLPDVVTLNRQFPQLEIRRLIGRGGMGAIYQARQTNLDRDVALKIIASEVSGDPAFAERFEREAKTLARLSHSNIVTVYDFGRTEDGLAYLIMEYVDGINLREAMASKSIGADDALAVVSTICDALQYAHDKGVVHRDIKPENILLSEEGAVKVADFGIAKIVDESIRTPTLTATRQVLGSMHYLAPEHLEAPGQVDHRVDLYALGVILYELLTGELPLGRYEPPSRLQGRANAKIDEIVLRTLNRRPNERYQRAAELGQDLSSVELEGNAPVIEPVAGAAGPPRNATGSTPAVPFTAQSHGGFGELVGMIRVTNEQNLKLEYRARDAIFGTIQSDTKVIEIPLADLVRFEFRPSVFGSKLRLVADSIESLSSLPGAETGQVTLYIKSEDREAAQALIDASDCQGASVGNLPAIAASLMDSTRSHPNWVPFSILSIFCAIFNAGMLAVVLMVASHEVSDVLEFNAIAISTSVIFGPIALLQLMNGLLGLTVRPIGFARATSIISMLPIAPAWIFSGPWGLWGYFWLREADQDTSMRSTASSPQAKVADGPRGWGATTMMFIRESRWGKLVTAGNVIAAVLAIGALAVYRSGIYQTELNFDIVDSSAPDIDLHQRIQERLGHDVGVSGYDGNVVVSLQANDRDRVIDLLRIESAIEVSWLVRLGDNLPTEDEASEIAEKNDLLETESRIPIARNLDVPSGFVTQDSTLGVSVESSIPLNRADFSDLDSNNPASHRLNMILTQKGSEKLEKLAPSDSDDYLPVLVVDGMVIGYLSDGSIVQRDLLFEFVPGSEFNARSIEAALRGPALGTDLELID